MKKIYLILISILTSITIIGCSKVQDKSEEILEEKITVYTSIFPMYDFTKNIGKDKINLNYIIPPGVEPHDYEITPKTIAKIQDADLIIKNGLGIDSFVDKAVKEAKKDIIICVASDGISAIKYEEEDDDHDHEEEDHEHGEYDPHIWLNPNLAKKQCENIKDALIKADSKNKDFYEENYRQYIEKLDELSANYKTMINSKSEKTLIVSHDAYKYLSKEYNLNTISITGLSASKEPSMAKLVSISNYVKENNIKYILFDGLINPKVATTIANETNAKTEVLYSIDGISKEKFAEGENYISLMEKNLDTLNRVLE